jgi:hypothetical protein
MSSAARSPLLFASTILLVACGGKVVVTPGADSGDEATSAGSGASGPSSSGAGASTSSGFGGAGTTSTGPHPTPAPCGGAHIDVVTEDGQATELSSVCAGDWSTSLTGFPAGYYVSGGAALQGLHLVGCATPDAVAERISLTALVDGPGSYNGDGVYVDSGGNAFQDMPPGSVKLALTSIGKVGFTIDGTYAMQVAKDEIVFSVSGAFSVCHVDDENLP